MDVDNGEGVDHGSGEQVGWRGTKEEKNGTSIIAKTIKHQK